MPTLQLTDFKNNLIDVNRPNRFIVQFNTPFLGVSDAVSYTIQDAKVPNYKINPIPIRFLGQKVNYRGQATFNDLQLTFIDDISNNAKNFVINWMNYIKNFNTPASANANNNYLQASLNLTRYDIENNLSSVYTFQNVLPVEMKEMNLSMDEKSKMATFELDIAYSYYNITINQNNYPLMNSNIMEGMSAGFFGNLSNIFGSSISNTLSSITSGIGSSITGDLTNITESAIMGQGFNLGNIGSNLLNAAKSTSLGNIQQTASAVASSQINALGV